MERQLILQPSKPGQSPRPALFLDRDGVLIKECHHLHDPSQVTLEMGSIGLLRAAFLANWPVVIITNQSGIARGYFGWDSYEAVTRRILELVSNPSPISAIYANGYGPEASDASWRKPSPVMLQKAGQDLNLDLSASILIGDRLSDLVAGSRAGLATVIHLLTGHGEVERPAVESRRSLTNHLLGEEHQPELLLLSNLLEFPSHRLKPQP